MLRREQFGSTGRKRDSTPAKLLFPPCSLAGKNLKEGREKNECRAVSQAGLCLERSFLGLASGVKEKEAKFTQKGAKREVSGPRLIVVKGQTGRLQ